MRPPLSLRIARLLLVAAGAFAAGLLVYIAAASSDPAGAWLWLTLIALNAGGFIAAARLQIRPHGCDLRLPDDDREDHLEPEAVVDRQHRRVRVGIAGPDGLRIRPFAQHALDHRGLDPFADAMTAVFRHDRGALLSDDPWRARMPTHLGEARRRTGRLVDRKDKPVLAAVLLADPLPVADLLCRRVPIAELEIAARRGVHRVVRDDDVRDELVGDGLVDPHEPVAGRIDARPLRDERAVDVLQQELARPVVEALLGADPLRECAARGNPVVRPRAEDDLLVAVAAPDDLAEERARDPAAPMPRMDADPRVAPRSEEHTSELQSRENLVCRLLLEKKKKK